MRNTFRYFNRNPNDWEYIKLFMNGQSFREYSILVFNMKLCLIVNPNAGKKQGIDSAEKTISVFKKRGIETSTLISNYPGHIPKLVKELDTETFDGIISVGGDGTLFEVINGLSVNPKGHFAPVGVIPVGTGNSFSKDLGIHTLEDAVEKIVSGNTKRIDTGSFFHSGKEHLFINLLGAGFVSNVAYRAKKYKFLGSLSYILGVLQEVIFLKTTRIELNIDGIIVKRDCVFVEICNSRYTGGDMLMSPHSVIDDGMLDVIVLNRVSRLKLLKLFPALFKGLHIEDDSVETFKGKNISLLSTDPMHLTPDGETFGKTPVDVSVRHGHIEMFT